jgi:predicted nuclease of predicted toxin-antitoxin system
MKFIANENFPIAAVMTLRNSGYDVIAIGENNPSTKDDEVMRFAIKDGRTILTFDRDYGELVFKQGYKPAAGVIYFRVESFKPDEPAQWVISLITKSNFAIEGMFTVYELDRTRQRKI